MSAFFHLGRVLFLLSCMLLTSCGGGGADVTAGIGGTGKTSGTITSFGSIFVNGVEYAIRPSTDIQFDDHAGTADDLRVGMVVTVLGNSNGTTDLADRVIYDDNGEGPVSDIHNGPDIDLNGRPTTRIFSLLGLTVVVDATGTVFAGLDFSSLADDDVVQVSGLFDQDGRLQATYVEKKGVLQPGTTVEVKGTVSNTTAAAFSLGTVRVEVGPSTDLTEIPGGTLANGQFVEASGIWIDSTTIDATNGKVELEEQLIGKDGDNLNLEGIVSDYVDDRDFKVAGLPVDSTNAQREPMNLALADGLRVQVVGMVTSTGGHNVLNATAIKTRDGNFEIQARITASPGVTIGDDTLNEGSIAVQAGDGTITVLTNSSTLLEDKTPRDAVPPLRLSDLSAGDFMRLRGYADDSGRFVATEARRDYPDDTLVQAPAEASNGVNSITLMGVTFLTNGDTEFEDADNGDISALTFYSLLNTGDAVRVEDSRADGTAEEVKRR